MEAQACGTVRAHTTQIGLIRKVTDGAARVVVLGDSYSEGAGLDGSMAWPVLAGASQGWETNVASVGSTGFVNQGPCGGQSFGQRLDRVLAANPQTLIIAGGVNDSESSPVEVQSAASAVLYLVAAVPNVVVIGPTNASAKNNLPDVDAALSKAAAANGRKYVSALSWDIEYQPDDLHPTESGQQAYARNVVAAMR